MSFSDAVPEPLPDAVPEPLLVPQTAARVETVPPAAAPAPQEPAETRFLKWLLFGSQGVRAGWMVALFLIITFTVIAIEQVIAVAVLHKLHIKLGGFGPAGSTFFESIQFLGLVAAAAVCARIERRRILDYNLAGPRRGFHFVTGSLAGFVALSALVGALYAGGWLHIGGVSLVGAAILEFGGIWGVSFLLTGLSEEGMTRCYMLFTLTRGINYWWALGSVCAFSLFALINPSGNGAGGVYLMAGLGVVPCLLLHLRKAPSAGFWEAAWFTSTLFGYMHTFNAGESWIGIFSAAALGFAFCVSVRLTGSAWWAIGFHGAWDWAQTFFYGTADSGFQPKGHYLTSTPAGPALWSGGVDGPEGSVLVIPVVALVIFALMAAYGRRKPVPAPAPSPQGLAA